MVQGLPNSRSHAESLSRGMNVGPNSGNIRSPTRRSILGPLHDVNIFMNSINDVHLLSQDTELILYADDILLFKPIDCQTDVYDLQQDFNRIVVWIREQGLSLDHSKTQLLPITRCRRQLAINLTVDGYPIVPSKSVKYLSVSISSNLTWSDHIRFVCKSAKRQLGMMHMQTPQTCPGKTAQPNIQDHYPPQTRVLLCGLHGSLGAQLIN